MRRTGIDDARALESHSRTRDDAARRSAFNTLGLTCPTHECARCDALARTKANSKANGNFTDVESIACRYRESMCDAMRAEEQRCKRASRALCRDTDVAKESKAKCAKVVHARWKSRCKEERAKFVAIASTAVRKVGEASARARSERERRRRGLTDGRAALDMELLRAKNAINAAYDSMVTNSGGVVFPGMSVAMEAFVSAPSALDTTADCERVAERLEEAAKELKVLESFASALCSRDASLSSNEARVTCEEIEDKSQLSERRQNRCAARLSDFLASTAKMDALIVEKNRRFKLLENLDTFMSVFTTAWDTAALENDDSVIEPSTRFNLTEHVTAGVVSSMMSHVTIASARRELATARVDESAFCAQVIPRLQLALLGHGVTRGSLACPPPHATYIAGRELPDWSAYFLFLLGIAAGVFGAHAANSTQKAIDFARENASVIVAILCVVLAGRFF